MAAFLARRYAEAVDVRRGDAAPQRFVWRGRHYTVREVLGHWVRTGAWWQRAGAACAGTGEPDAAEPGAGAGSGALAGSGLVTAELPPAPRWGQRAWGEPAPEVGVAAVPGEVDDDEREFWRVEATVGRGGSPVVVELCFAWATGAWTVTAVAD